MKKETEEAKVENPWEQDPQLWIKRGLFMWRRYALERGEPLTSGDIEQVFPSLLGPEKVVCGAGWPSGWNHLIWVLLSMVSSHNEGADKSTGSPIVINQIKEKFGGLRFYWGGGYAKRDSEHHYAWPSLAEVHGAVDFAEAYSEIICDTTGSIQNLRVSVGWVGVRQAPFLEDRNSVPLGFTLNSTRPR